MPDVREAIDNLKRQKERIAMVDEMARRINIDKIRARRLLAHEIVYSEREKREFDMVRVAWAIYALKGT